MLYHCVVQNNSLMYHCIVVYNIVSGIAIVSLYHFNTVNSTSSLGSHSLSTNAMFRVQCCSRYLRKLDWKCFTGKIPVKPPLEEVLGGLLCLYLDYLSLSLWLWLGAEPLGERGGEGETVLASDPGLPGLHV